MYVHALCTYIPGDRISFWPFSVHTAVCHTELFFFCWGRVGGGGRLLLEFKINLTSKFLIKPK